MRLTWIAAAAAAATGMAVPAVTGGEWPDSPNKPWFENLQRPDTTSVLTRTSTRSHAVVQATW